MLATEDEKLYNRGLSIWRVTIIQEIALKIHVSTSKLKPEVSHQDTA
jgi:hypothetical protein